MEKTKTGPAHRIVQEGTDGKWREKAEGARRASSVHATQKQAVQAAREKLRRSGGGKLVVIGRDNKIRVRETVPPEYEPVASMALQLELVDRLRLLQELLGTITNEVVEEPAKHSIFELKGVGAEMWREIDVNEYLRNERASWDG